jgi:hypothetical protein
MVSEITTPTDRGNPDISTMLLGYSFSRFFPSVRLAREKVRGEVV